MSQPERRMRARLSRSAFLLPSSFTVGNLFLGFYAVVTALGGRYERAAVCVIVAGILDNLDGRIARLTHTESEFGKEFDSLADFLTFGIAPGMVTYLWGLHELLRIGYLVGFLYVVCAATRLARFNIQAGRVDSRYFVGMPSPAAAGTVVSFLLLAEWHGAQPWYPVAMAALVATCGVLMVTTFRYPALKQLDFGRPLTYRVALPIAALLLLVAFEPRFFLPTVATVYGLAGPWLWLKGRLFRRRAPPVAGDGA